MNGTAPPLESDADLIRTPDAFAEMIAGRSPASVVHRDERVMAFLDVQPITEGQTLVVPLRTVRFLDEPSEAETAQRSIV